MYNQGQPVSEFQLTQADFEKFSRLVYEQSGISLHDGKKELIKARLSKRVRQGRFKSFRDYYQYVVQDDSGEELVFLLDSISTNLTSFFREQSHFDYLKNELLPRWKTARKGSGPANSRLERRLLLRGGGLFHFHHLAGGVGASRTMENQNLGHGPLH